jgi:trimeric autotransporter adhesin
MTPRYGLLPVAAICFVAMFLAPRDGAAQTVDFGNVQLPYWKDSTYTFTNTLPTPVDIIKTRIKKIGGDFIIITGAAPFTIPANGTHVMTIRFAPTNYGLYVDSMYVEGLFPGSPIQVKLRGTGVTWPVELQSLTARRLDGRVELRWVTAQETNNVGFEVQRGTATGSDFTIAGFVPGSGSTHARREYAFTDERDVPADAAVSYRLRQIDADGGFEYSPVVTVAADASAASRLDLTAGPNPASDRVTFRYLLREDARVRLTLCDASGRAIAVLHEGEAVSGSHAISARLADLPRGAYVVTLQAGRESASRTLLLH